ncbi:hypothetical protein B0H11DRAFT_1949312, partial [Mycena galericulata]
MCSVWLQLRLSSKLCYNNLVALDLICRLQADNVHPCRNLRTSGHSSVDSPRSQPASISFITAAPDHLPTYWQCSTRRMAPLFFVLLRALCRPHAPAPLRPSRPSTRNADLISNPPFISLHKPAHVPSDVGLPRTPCRCPRATVPESCPAPELFDATISGRYPGNGTPEARPAKGHTAPVITPTPPKTPPTHFALGSACVHSLCGVASPDGRRAMRDY